MTWFEDLYNRQIYLDLYAPEDIKLAKIEIDRLVRILELSPEQTILDVCCGYGRHALELARRGFTVTGIDLASRQIDAAKIQANAEDLDVTFQCGDAREMIFARPFDVTLNLFTSFGFFPTDAENRRMLGKIFEATSPGGSFLLDFWNRERILRKFTPQETETRPDGIRIDKQWEFDAINGRINWDNQVIFPDGKHARWSQSVRAYTLFEIRTLLEAVGFTVDKVFGNWEGREYSVEFPPDDHNRSPEVMRSERHRSFGFKFSLQERVYDFSI